MRHSIFFSLISAFALVGLGTLSIQNASAQSLSVEEQQTLAELDQAVFSKIDEAMTLFIDGSTAEASTIAIEALRNSHEMLGADDLVSLGALGILAPIFIEAGYYENLELLLTSSIVIASQKLGEVDEITTRLQSNLGSLQIAQSRFGDAEALLENLLEIRTRSLGLRHADTLTTMSDLGTVYYSQGKYEDARSLLFRSHQLGEEVFGSEDPRTLSTIVNLGAVYSELGLLDMSELLLQEGLSVSININGVRHRQTLSFLNNLAKLSFEQGHWDEAEDLTREAMELAVDLYGADHPRSLTAKSNVAHVLRAQSKYGEAVATYSDVLDRASTKFGNQSLLVETAKFGLAETYRLIGRTDKSAELVNDILSKSTEAVDTARALGLLAKIYEENGEFVNAERELLTAINIYGGLNSFPAYQTNPVRVSLASLYIRMERYEEANMLLEAALSTSKAILGDAHPDTIAIAGTQSLLLFQTGDATSARELLIENIASLERDGSIDRSGLAANYSNLAYLLSQDEAQLGVAIYFQKLSVNILQSVRKDSRGLDEIDQQSFLSRKSGEYEVLQEWLVKLGRFAEAEQVGRMLKQKEYYEYIRRDLGGKTDPRTIRLDLTTTENEWQLQRASWAEKTNRVAVTMNALEDRQKSGEELSELELIQLGDLKADYNLAYSGYKQQLNVWLASVRAIEDETIQAEARALEARYHDDLQQELAQIGDNVAVLQIVAFEEGVHFFLITPRAFKHVEHPISRVELNEAIFATRTAILPNAETGRLGANPQSELQELYRLLFAPIAEEVQDAGTQTIMLNLQGAIRYVPFAALHDGSDYLMNQYELALFTPAARTRYNKSAQFSDAAGFGVSTAYSGFQGLPGVETELQAIFGSSSNRGLLHGPTFLDADFTRSALVTELSRDRSVIHIASHFYMQPGNDANSFLLLGDGTQLSLTDINLAADLRFDGVELLTLSACSTALNSQGDYDVNSLTGVEVEGFGVLAQRKGAEAVVASLWDVGDDSTPTLMTEMYANLVNNGLNKAEALQAAQKSVASNPSTSHPYFWAPFILLGDWT